MNLRHRARRLYSTLLLLLILLGGTGCAYHYKHVTGLPPNSEGRTVTEWRHIGLWGLVEEDPFDLEKACPEGVAEFGSYVSLPNWLCRLVTIGLYSPRTVYAIPAKQ